MKNTIIIPARSGSKRLKNKNFLQINGESLIERTINFSKKIKNIDQIIVSTDSSKIIHLQKKYKNIFFVKRPKYLSTDRSLIIYTINNLHNKFNKNFKNIIILQPTSPFRSQKIINDQWIRFINLKKKFKSLVSVSIGKNLEKKKFIIKNNKLVLNKKKKNKKLYEANGNYFMANIKFLKKYKKFVVSEKTIASVIKSKKNLIDIDTKKDYKLALKYK